MATAMRHCAGNKHQAGICINAHSLKGVVPVVCQLRVYSMQPLDLCKVAVAPGAAGVVLLSQQW